MPYIAAGSAVVGAAGAIKAGNDARDQAELAAQQMKEEADATQAAAQRQMIEDRRTANRLQSRALAVAAASGAGASDPTVALDIGRIQSEGEYRALSRLYSGDAEAQNLKRRAKATQAEGAAQQSASRWKAASTILSTGAGLYDRYYGTA